MREGEIEGREYGGRHGGRERGRKIVNRVRERGREVEGGGLVKAILNDSVTDSASLHSDSASPKTR